MGKILLTEVFDWFHEVYGEIDPVILGANTANGSFGAGCVPIEAEAYWCAAPDGPLDRDMINAFAALPKDVGICYDSCPCCDEPHKFHITFERYKVCT